MERGRPSRPRSLNFYTVTLKIILLIYRTFFFTLYSFENDQNSRMNNTRPAPKAKLKKLQR